MPDKKNLLLITDGFPYGDSERYFITKEFEILSVHFNVYTLALTNLTEVKYHEPDPGKHYRLSWTKKELLGQIGALFTPAFHQEIKKNKDKKYILKYQLMASFYQQYIQQIIEEEHIDIVYSYWCTAATLAAVRIGACPVVSRFHGYDLYNYRAPGGFQPFREEIIEGLTHMIFVSEYGKRYMKETWPVTDIDKCTVSYIGTGQHKRIINDNYTFVSCSSCYELKRIDKIIDALAIIPDKYHIKWIHVGEGGIFEELKEQAKDLLDNKPNIEYVFEGFVPNERLQEVYEKHQAGAFITTSSTEGLPITIVEAQSMGLPVIATDVGGISELVTDIDTDPDNTTGYLMSSDPTIDEVAQTIMRYCDASYGVHRTMSDNAHTKWGLYHYDAQNASKLAELLKRL